ncbi:MAG: hypothetical protein M3127_04260 [Actinomycetota bacterium]|nr:hypothetical protein [Actinomycetota bacterium]
MEFSAAPSPDKPADNQTGQVRPAHPARYARPVLIAGAVGAVVCLVLLGIIFLLDSFNSTVYSVGGKNINDATDEARQIRDLYAGARIGAVVFLIASALAAAAAAAALVRWGKDLSSSGDDGGENVGFDALTGR